MMLVRVVVVVVVVVVMGGSVARRGGVSQERFVLGPDRSGIPSTAGMLDRRLLYFLAVAREGSFSRAADVLHVAQPAVSRQVALLEAEIGVRLLDRSPAGVVATDAGRRLLERGAALERDAAVLHDELRAFGVGSRGRVALGYSTSVGYGTAPVLIEGLRRRLPEVEVRPLLLPTPELGRAVREGSLDLALVRSAVLVDGV